MSSQNFKRAKKEQQFVKEDDTIEEERFLSAVIPEDGNKETITYLFKGEGHTLGNALRFVISTYPEVKFCAYTLPHPAEDVMHFRIQAFPGILPIDMLQRGLHDLIKLSEVIVEKFQDAMAVAPPQIPDEDELINKIKQEKGIAGFHDINRQSTSKSKSKHNKGSSEADIVSKKLEATKLSKHTDSDDEDEETIPDEEDDGPEPELVDLE